MRSALETRVDLAVLEAPGCLSCGEILASDEGVICSDCEAGSGVQIGDPAMEALRAKMRELLAERRASCASGEDEGSSGT